MLSVLIVDDEKGAAKLLGDILSDLFDAIFYASDGQSALQIFKKNRPSIVICDVLMPLKDGLSLAREIKEMSPKTPIIICSAHSDSEKLLAAIDASVDKYLIKPIKPEELIESVKKQIAKISYVVQLGKYTIDFKHSAFIKPNKEIITLSKKELAVLKELSSPVGKVISADEIKQIGWANSDIKDGSVRTFIKRLRDKLGCDIIKNVTLAGYKLSLE